jgi:hypothetical protein
LRIGLPDLDQRVLDRRPFAVEHLADDADALAVRRLVGQSAADDAGEGIAVLFGRQREGEERADGLGWGL